ncbi:COMM domain-containing protein 2 isoform X1 [Rhynchophorus ferrugineus]|uniref:COMM domain-containing protein 2 isoform X1 n=1 Tax=Rhynchophorus ferrugineus TaxID=354439 RepID=UPI003FCD5EF3
MLLSVSTHHKKHLNVLSSQPKSVVADFCKLTSQFLNSGPNKKRYTSAAEKLSVSVDVIENCIYGLVHLVHLASKQKISDHDFEDSALALGFTEEQVSVISQFYQSIKGDVEKLDDSVLNEPHYHDLQWRFEVQLSSRSLLEQVTPLVLMELSLKSPNTNNSNLNIKRHLFQTDPTNLLHLTNELDRALNESRSRYSRKVQNIISNIQ